MYLPVVLFGLIGLVLLALWRRSLRDGWHPIIRAILLIFGAVAIIAAVLYLATAVLADTGSRHTPNQVPHGPAVKSSPAAHVDPVIPGDISAWCAAHNNRPVRCKV